MLSCGLHPFGVVICWCTTDTAFSPPSPFYAPVSCWPLRNFSMDLCSLSFFVRNSHSTYKRLFVVINPDPSWPPAPLANAVHNHMIWLKTDLCWPFISPSFIPISYQRDSVFKNKKSSLPINISVTWDVDGFEPFGYLPIKTASQYSIF